MVSRDHRRETSRLVEFRPQHRTSWIRATAVLAVVLVGIGAGALVLASHGPGVGQRARSSAIGGCQRLAAWRAGSGYRDLSRVTADLAAASRERRAGNITAEELTGSRLETAAAAAAAAPPPVGTVVYVQGMSGLSSAGQLLTEAYDAVGNSALLKGAAALHRAMSQATACG